MEAKVKEMLDLVQENAGLKVQIFSGTNPGNVMRALKGELLGTEIST
jgi:isopentenyl phosphate kinase